MFSHKQKMVEVRILVCGGRAFMDYEKMDVEISKALEVEFREGRWPPIFICGAARGADSLIIDWAARNGFECIEYPADWEKYGPSAGPRRNQQMLDEGKPDIVIAFPGGKGTQDMTRRAMRAGVPVRIISP